MKAERINYRFAACGCGCEGRDPWHKASYRRRVSNVRVEHGSASVRGLGEQPYKRIGEVRLPMSTKPVRVVDINLHTASTLWAVDTDSVEFDK